VNWGRPFPRTERTKSGSTRKLRADIAAAKIVSRVETLAGRVFLERTCAGHKLGTMRLLGRRRHLLIEIRSRDDATRVRSGASTTKLLRWWMSAHFLKPLARLSA